MKSSLIGLWGPYICDGCCQVCPDQPMVVYWVTCSSWKTGAMFTNHNNKELRRKHIPLCWWCTGKSEGSRVRCVANIQWRVVIKLFIYLFSYFFYHIEEIPKRLHWTIFFIFTFYFVSVFVHLILTPVFIYITKKEMQTPFISCF